MSSFISSFLLIFAIQASIHLPQPVHAIALNLPGFQKYLHKYLFLNLILSSLRGSSPPAVLAKEGY